MTQAEALDVLKMGHNVFLTGPPGSGKTYVLNSFIKYLKKYNIPVGVTASTGIAATHISGMTIHSWSGIGIHDEISDEQIEKLLRKNQLAKRYSDTKVLIIDEVSMLHGARLDLVDKICKAFKKSDKPFGGLQVVLTGDLFQLPPVTRNRGENEVDFVFKSNAWKNLNIKVCYLSEQHRQDDTELLNVLNKIRLNQAGYAELDTLQTRQIDDAETNSTRLYTHNVDVNAINQLRLDEISENEVRLSALTKGNATALESLIKSCLAPEELVLKVGAEIMCVANSPAQGFVNGSRGIVINFDEETNAPIIKLHGRNRLITLERHTWSIADGDRVVAELSQYPLRLAWAITIHKSQGMSLDSAEVDLGRSFEPGMGYVALSRLRTLEGLVLRGINELALKVHPEVLEFDEKLRINSKGVQAGLAKIDKSAIASHHENVKSKLSSTEFTYDKELLVKLKGWRTKTASKFKIPPYVVLDDLTLKTLSAKKPSEPQTLLEIKGVGEKKKEKYGADIIAIITTHEQESNS